MLADNTASNIKVPTFPAPFSVAVLFTLVNLASVGFLVTPQSGRWRIIDGSIVA
ncbi:MAG TPA: hypothetical protein VK629_21130 [Steroidobacteraceae bacterium]|nr:hypothetical protein [Steroidobacteraceae bacterium]